MLAFTDLSGTNLQRADALEAILVGAKFDGANLDRTCFSYSELGGARLTNAICINKVIINGANLSGADLSNCNLSGANFSECNLSRANLNSADLTGTNLSRAILIETNMRKATLTGCSIFGISAWSVELEGAAQHGLVITPANEPIITVDNLKIAQFIFLLLNNAEIRDVINIIGQKGVLILGRFGGGGLEFLHAIGGKLREMNYLPIIFDFERPNNRDFTETIMTLAGLSRFVIADLSGPSVPNELRATIPHFKIPFVPIIEKGRKVYTMFPDLLGYPWVLSPVEFSSKEQLMELLSSNVIAPAEEKFKERQTLLNELFDR